MKFVKNSRGLQVGDDRPFMT